MAHLTAARMHRIWLPRLPDWLPALVVLPPGEQRPERRDVYAFRSRAALPRPVVVDDTCVVPAEVCLGQLAEDLCVLDQVIAVDAALHMRLCGVADIEAAMRPRQRGLPMLRRSLALCDGRSESPWETVLRVLHVTAGIDVQPQAKIKDGEGRVYAHADLRIRGTRRLPEYDGAGHREREKHQADLAREKSLARERWDRYGYTAQEILGNPVRVLRDAEESLGWAHDPARLTVWRQLVRESSFSPGGRALLARRLQRFNRALYGGHPPG